MELKTLFAGPFIGEFGIELFWYQGHIRKIARNYDRVIVSSRPDMEYLYRDFYDVFIPYDPGSHNADGYECIDNYDIPKLHEKYDFTKLIRILDLKSYLKELKNEEQEFVSYGEKKEKIADICICVRNFKKGAKTKIQRNWDPRNAEEFVRSLLDLGYSVACLGLSENSEYIENTINYMDLPLEDTANILRSSKLIIGPSSGLMHFASLCECPQFVWGEKHLRKRYEKEWNPLKTNIYYVERDEYNLSSNEIIDFFNKNIHNRI